MKIQLRNMLDLQDQMNSKVHSRWREQDYPWHRAIWTECAELMDHHGWKWWKKQTPDFPQIQLEVVDIWHFGMSQLLQNEPDVEKVCTLIESQWNLDTQTNESFLHAVEALALYCLEHQSFSIRAFCQLVLLSDLSFDELYRQYIGKNVLNFFRQDHGYKDGSYHKTWHGKEDNEHLAEVLKLLDPTAIDYQDAVYTMLEHRYPHTN